MIVARQMEIRANMKRYFDMASDGEEIIVSRKQSRNVVILSEERYNALKQHQRLEAYAERASMRYDPPHAKNSLRSDNLEKLRRIASLKENWNGNGAPAIPPEVISKVEKLIHVLPIQPEIFPTAMRTIQFEFDNSRHDHMELEIGVSDKVELFIATYFGDETEEEILSDIETITKRVLQFYG